MATDTKQKIPAGYKQTEVGVIPEDWEIKNVIDFGSIVTGSTPSTKVKDYWNGNIPWITPTDITSKKDIYDSERKITTKGLSVIRKLPANSLLVTCIASIGKNTILRRDGASNQQINAIIPNGNYNVNYLYYNFEKAKNYLIGHAGITATNIVSKQTFALIKFAVPSLQEQTAIADALSDADALIEKLEKLIEKKKQIKQGAMQELLGIDNGQLKMDNGLAPKRRLPGFSGEWEVRRIGDIFRVTRGQVLAMTKLQSSKMGEYKYPVYSSQTHRDGLAGFYNDYLFEDCITWTTDGANAGEVKYRSGKFYCTNVCGVLESKAGYANPCIAAIFNSISRKYVSYVGNPKLMNNTVADIVIRIPKAIDEQNAIAEAFLDMKKEITKQEAILAKYRQMKIGMMQQLLTGKIRLIDKG